MNNILQSTGYQTMLARIDAVQAGDRALWGRMSVNQMICHLADQIRVALGGIKTTDRSNFVSRTVVAWLVLLGVPAPKGKIPTFPGIDQVAGKGTPPTELDEDKRTLRAILDEFIAMPDDFAFQHHSAFGKLSKSQWARLIYVHMDHHLKQFGR